MFHIYQKLWEKDMNFKKVLENSPREMEKFVKTIYKIWPELDVNMYILRLRTAITDRYNELHAFANIRQLSPIIANYRQLYRYVHLF